MKRRRSRRRPIWPADRGNYPKRRLLRWSAADSISCGGAPSSPPARNFAGAAHQMRYSDSDESRSPKDFQVSPSNFCR